MWCKPAAVVAAALLVASVGTLSAGATQGLTLEPSEGLTGGSVVVVPDFKFATDCAVFWDGADVADAVTCGSEQPIEITASGEPGIHTVVLCTAGCDGAEEITESASFVIDELVPSLSGFPLHDADQQLANAGLVGMAAGFPNEQDTVVSSEPTAGAVIAPGGTVQLVVSVPAPTSSTSTQQTSSVDRTTVNSSRTTVGSVVPPTQRRSTRHNGLVPLPPSRTTVWPVAGGAGLAALLALTALAWWLRRRALSRAGRHVRPQRAASVHVMTRHARTRVWLDRDPRPARTVDIRTTRRTTVQVQGDR